jgi:hypothetical protein
MKLKYFFPFFFVAVALMVSCQEEDSVTLLDGIQVSSSYVSIPVAGGSTSITVKANDSWTAEKVTTTKNPVAWLSISSTTGSAGESELTFTAASTLDGRTAEVLIKCGGETQRINIIQGVAVISSATCAEVIAGPDSKTYQVTGVCTSIDNTIYGNWYLKDATGSVYIYGTLDAKGNTKNFASLGIEVGDEVTVQGPKTTYGTTVELVNVTVVKINKSLVKVDSVKNAALTLDGGEFIAYLTCKGQGISVEIPADASSWLSIKSIQSAGTKSVVKFNAAANAGGDRGTTLTFHTTDGTKDYSAQTTLTQKGAIINASVAQFIAAAVGTTQYRLKGVITSISDAATGKLNIRDYSGEVYVYKIVDFATKGLKVGDIITIVGTRAAYNGTPQVNGAVLESSISVTATTIADVLTKPDDATKYFMVTGVITLITSDVYGNLYLNDGSEIYVYGCSPGYGATGTAKQGLVTAKGLKVGDTLTIIGTKGSYSGTIEFMNSFYYSHVSAK